jgi:hypothetical protein
MKVIDYAEHVTATRIFLKKSEKHMVDREWDDATYQIDRAVVELRLLKSQIQLLKENDGIPYQVELQQPEAL